MSAGRERLERMVTALVTGTAYIPDIPTGGPYTPKFNAEQVVEDAVALLRAIDAHGFASARAATEEGEQ